MYIFSLFVDQILYPAHISIDIPRINLFLMTIKTVKFPGKRITVNFQKVYLWNLFLWNTSFV